MWLSRNSAITWAETEPNFTGLFARACVSRQIFAYSSWLRGLWAILPVTIGHRHDVFYAGVAQGGRRAQAVAVERIEMRVESLLPGGFDKQCQVIAPVASNHRVGAACADLGNVRREVLHAAGGDEFIGDDRNVRTALLQRTLGFAADVVAEAVVLVE